MKAMTTYFTFDGNARDAMTFYQECLGGKLDVMTFGDAHASDVPEARDRLMHANLNSTYGRLMASDTMPGMPFTQGTNFSVAITCDTPDEVTHLAEVLGAGGKVTMEPQETFFALRFAMVTDKFGIGWMFNCEKPMGF